MFLRCRLGSMEKMGIHVIALLPRASGAHCSATAKFADVASLNKIR